MVPSQVLLCTAEVNLVDLKNNKTFPAKALLDSGSQSSFLTEKIQKKMNLLSSRTNQITVRGVNNTVTNVVKVCELPVRSRINDFCVDVSCLIIPQITGNLPNVPVDVSKLKLPFNIQLADTSFFQPSEIHILLGADVFWDVVMYNQIKLSPNQPTLQESKFGWLVAGPFGSLSKSPIIKFNVTSLKRLKILLLNSGKLRKFHSLQNCCPKMRSVKLTLLKM